MPIVRAGGEPNSITDRMRMVLQADRILEIHDAGVRVVALIAI